MLWRASQVIRQFPPANLLRPVSRETTVGGPIRHSIRCGSVALALQARAVARHPSTTYQHHKPEAHQPSKLPSQRLQRSLVATLPQPDPRLVNMIDVLYARRREGGWTREDLESCVESPELLAQIRDREKAVELAALMVNTDVPRRAIRTLILAHDFGCNFIQNMYERIAYQLAQTRRWAELPALVFLGKKQSGKTTVRLLNWRTRALVEISQYRLLDNVLVDFEEAQLQPNRQTFNTLVTGHLRNRDLEKAQDCVEWMQDAGFPMDASTHALLTSGYRSLGADPHVKERALAHIPHMTPKDGTIVVNSLLQVASDANDTGSIDRFVSLFDQAGGFSSRGDVGASHAVHQNGTPSRTISRAKSRLRSELYPDVATFTILVNFAAKTANYPLAMQMVERMKEYDIQPDSYFAASLIRLHGVTNRFPIALDISATLCDSTPLALSHLRSLGWKGQLYSDFVSVSVTHSPQTMNALLKVALRNKGIRSMRYITNFMRELGLKHNEHTVETFLRHLMHSPRVRPRELAQVLHILSRQICPTVRQVNIVYAALLRQQRAQTVPSGWSHFARHARHSREATSSGAVGDLPSASSESGHHGSDDTSAVVSSGFSFQKVLRPVLRFLAKNNVLPDSEMAGLHIRYGGIVKRDVESAQAHFQSMLDRGLHPTRYHYAALIESYCQAGDIHNAKAVLKAARRAGFATDPVMYTIIIDGYARVLQPMYAQRVFRMMVARGIQPDVASVDALARAFFVAGRMREARLVLTEHWPSFGQFPPELRDASLKKLAREFRKLGRSGKLSGAGQDSRGVGYMGVRAANLRKMIVRRSCPQPRKRRVGDRSLRFLQCTVYIRH